MWNPTDDYAYVNGHKTAVKCYLKSTPIWANGDFQIEVENGVYKPSAGFTLVSNFGVDGNTLYTNPTQQSTGSTILSKNMINVDNYSKIKMRSNVGDLEVNISAITGNAYLWAMGVYTAAGRYVGVGLSRTKANFNEQANYIIGLDTSAHSLASGRLEIYEITLE